MSIELSEIYPRTINPARPGVYRVTTIPDFLSWGYARWNGDKWEPYGRWGNYIGKNIVWFWVGLTGPTKSSRWTVYPA